MDIEELNKMLTDHSTNLYSIEYGGYLSNHISHGIVALYRLGASRKRIQQFIDWYSQKLEKGENQNDQLVLPEGKSSDRYDFNLLLGKRVAYFPLVSYYKSIMDNKCNNSMETFISHYFPSMCAGIVGSALHPLIHMGYGYSIKNPVLVTEGMAYLHHSYKPLCFINGDVNWSFGQGTTDIVEAFDVLRRDKTLIDFMLKETSGPEWKSWDELYEGNPLMKRVTVLVSRKADVLASYVQNIKLPQWFSVDKLSIAEVLKLVDWLIDMALVVYQGSERRNDFFILHGVTSAWSLRNVLSAFPETQVDDAVVCLKLYICVLLAVYLAQGSPVINMSLVKQSVHRPWDDIISEVLKDNRDEHIYKLTQICYERYRNGSVPEYSEVYKAAVLSSMNYPFVF